MAEQSILIKKLQDISTRIGNAIDTMVERGAAEPDEKTAFTLLETAASLPVIAVQETKTIKSNTVTIINASDYGVDAMKSVAVTTNVPQISSEDATYDPVITKNDTYTITAEDCNVEAMNSVIINVLIDLDVSSYISNNVSKILMPEDKTTGTYTYINFRTPDDFYKFISILSYISYDYSNDQHLKVGDQHVYELLINEGGAWSEESNINAIALVVNTYMSNIYGIMGIITLTKSAQITIGGADKIDFTTTKNLPISYIFTDESIVEFINETLANFRDNGINFNEGGSMIISILNNK